VPLFSIFPRKVADEKNGAWGTAGANSLSRAVRLSIILVDANIDASTNTGALICSFAGRMTFVSKQNRLSLNLGHRLELALMVLLLLLLIAGGVLNSLGGSSKSIRLRSILRDTLKPHLGVEFAFALCSLSLSEDAIDDEESSSPIVKT